MKKINWIFREKGYLLNYKELKWAGERVALCHRGKEKNPELLGLCDGREAYFTDWRSVSA